MADQAAPPRPDVRPARPSPSPGGGEAPERDLDSVIDAAAKLGRGEPEALEADEQVDALEWFLSDTDATDLTHSFQINVGTGVRRRWIDWTVKPIDMDRLKRIRRSSQDRTSRRARLAGQSGEFDEVAANVQIVIEGTVKPDLRAASREIGTVDPGMAVRTRFAHKPGLLAQIAGEIMNISGYDDEDIREVDAARG